MSVYIVVYGCFDGLEFHPGIFHITFEIKHLIQVSLLTYFDKALPVNKPIHKGYMTYDVVSGSLRMVSVNIVF